MPLTPTETKKLLERLGHRPRQSLGQNFLIDPNVVQKQLRLGLLKAGDIVVEVGPGLGTLTEALLEAGADVYAVELDRGLAQYIRQTFVPKYPDTLHLLEADAVLQPLAGLLESKGTEDLQYSVIANLPYAISTPWIAQVLKQPVLPQRLVIMLQKEAADRLVANFGTKSLGPISIVLQAAFKQAGTHAVSRQVFYPIPDVDSCLLVLEQKNTPHRFKKETLSLIQRIFTQRRKQLGNLIRQEKTRTEELAAWVKALEAVGIPLTIRPEGIPLDSWINLDNLFI